MNQKGIDTKVFKVLAYIFFLWIIGLLCPYKNDKDVRFHVGQGIILTISLIVGYILVLALNVFVVENIFRTEIIIFGTFTGNYVVTETGLLIEKILRISVFVVYFIYMLIGIINGLKEREKKLPLIGQFAFYK